MTIHNYDSGRQPSGETWDTQRLQEEFEVLAFMVKVRRKSDGAVGSMEFTHNNPRLYFDFVPVASS